MIRPDRRSCIGRGGKAGGRDRDLAASGHDAGYRTFRLQIENIDDVAFEQTADFRQLPIGPEPRHTMDWVHEEPT